METIVNLPNDTVAIICEINDNKNNTYTIIPREVSLGRIDKFNKFITEEDGKTIPSLEDVYELEDDQVNTYYVFPKKVEELKQDYSTVSDKLNMMMYCYLRDMASKLNIALKSNDKVYIYSKNYDVISKEIAGELRKHYEEVVVPDIVIPNEETKTEDRIDQEGLEKFVKERVFKNDSIIEDIVTTFTMNYTATRKEEIESILSIGQTGTGKTSTYEAISEYANIPLTIYDCNLLTSAGYVGNDINDVMREVYLSCNGDPKLASRSILMLDEVDKLAMRGLDVKDAAVQFALLKLLDGYRYSFEKVKNGPQIVLDSSFMTIAFCGAFPDMYEAKNKEGSMGFKDTVSSNHNDKFEFTTDDLVKFGMLREFIGRVPNIFTYENLTKDDLKRILLHSKNSVLLLKQARYIREFNTFLEFNNAFIDAIVEEAFEKKTGGRGLKNIVSRTFKKLDRELSRDAYRHNLGVKKLSLTQEIVENNTKFNI